jgi:group I intron endonuclease
MFIGYIYKTVNLYNNKVYIGQCGFLPEITADYLGSGKIIKRSIKKRGIFYFKKEILGIIVSLNKEDFKLKLNEAETLCIDFFQSTNPIYGYNISPVGGSTRGLKSSEITKEKLRKVNGGKNNGMYGKKHSEKTKKEWSKKRKGCISSKGMLGKKHSEETKIKMKLSHKNRPQVSEETRNKMSKSLKGKVRTEEQRKRISESRKKYFESFKKVN